MAHEKFAQNVPSCVRKPNKAFLLANNERQWVFERMLYYRPLSKTKQTVTLIATGLSNRLIMFAKKSKRYVFLSKSGLIASFC